MKKIVLVLTVMIGILFGGDFDEAEKEAEAENYTKAIKLYQSASDHGDPKASFYLGMFYLLGSMGLEKDRKRAISLWYKSADLGYVDAQNALGLMYRDKYKNYAKAIEFFQKGAEQGNPQSQFLLGHMYADGMAVKQDYAKAAEFYQKAADQGYVMAQNNLARMYRNGQGVKQDKIKSYQFYTKAVKQGSIDAQINLDILCKESPEICKSISQKATIHAPNE